ncbi:hypothetical protein [Burkholderia sp. BCC0322]|uniref:hypothetical protein n=1 Tax=unclassified Burkholderia TaxID=2613784 RepID=UPI00158E8820|nr:hypothetical protein [Burkholderia sp. BCC0322]
MFQITQGDREAISYVALDTSQNQKKLVEPPVESDPPWIGLLDSVPGEERRAPAIRVTARTRSASCAHYASNRKRSANRIRHYFLCWRRTLQNTANFFKSISLIRFNLVSYNQKKFDIALSFLITSDASNLTNCSLRTRFRSTFFRFRRTAVLAAGCIVRAPAHATSRCISLDDCHPAAGRRIEPNEQDTETVALAIPPAPGPAQLRRIAAQPSRYRVFRISPPEKHHVSGSGERPCRVRAIRTHAAEIGGA